jgi:hypothetical protein
MHITQKTYTMKALTRIAMAVILTVAMVGLPFAARTVSAQGTAAQALTIPITGTGAAGTFAGTFQLQKFVSSQGQLLASGVLTGTVTAANGTVTSIVKTITLPATVAQASCEILHLDLGPLTLNLLGLNVTLSRVVLDISAQPGPGNLLGNLLCSVANLLNNPGALANLLNQILALL